MRPDNSILKLFSRGKGSVFDDPLPPPRPLPLPLLLVVGFLEGKIFSEEFMSAVKNNYNIFCQMTWNEVFLERNDKEKENKQKDKINFDTKRRTRELNVKMSESIGSHEL